MYLFKCITNENIGINKIDKPIVYGNNTHNYEINTNYCHFFKFSKDAIIFKLNYNKYVKDNNKRIGLIMIIDIPDDIVKPYFGYGIYQTDIPGYDTLPKIEYAIPLELIKPEYIVSYKDTIDDKYKNDIEFNKYINFITEEVDKCNSSIEELQYHLLSLKKDGD